MNEIENVINEMAIIAAGTRIIGNITTKGHITVEGTVVGDIIAEGNIIITGTVKGKIRCHGLIVQSGKVQSEIEAAETVVIREDAEVKGSVVCRDIAVMGKITGDVTAKTIGIEPGAKIDGYICVK